MAQRRLTTLEQLTAKQDALATQSKLLKKQRDALTRQRKRMERKAQEQQWQDAGTLVERHGFPVHDLDALKALLIFLEPERQRWTQKQAMSSTASAALAPQEPEAR